MYIDQLDDIVSKCNNAYHSTIKRKHVDVKQSASIEYSKENNYQDPKFKNCDFVGIPKYKNIFTKVYTRNWSEEVKTLCRRHMLLVILKPKN